MVIGFSARHWTEKIQNHQPTRRTQYTIGCAGDTKQVFTITQIKAETKNHNIKSLVVKWQNISRSLLHIKTLGTCRRDRLGRGFDAVTISIQIVFKPGKADAFTTPNFKHLDPPPLLVES